MEDNENKGAEFLESTMGLLNQHKQQQEEIADEFTKLFSAPVRKRQRGDDKYLAKAQTDPRKYLGVVDVQLTEGNSIPNIFLEQEAERQNAIQEYMQEYNSQYRQKTLMEEHLEKKQDRRSKDHRSKNEKLKDQMLKGFDKEKDLKYSGIDSQKTFGIINKNGLDKRFTPGSTFL